MERRRTGLLWAGFLTTLLAIIINVPAIFVAVPGHAAVWLSLLLSGAALALLVLGLTRAFRRPELYRGKVIGSILTALAVLVLVGSVIAFAFSRHIPPATAAPQVGQKAPPFTLTDSHGRQFSLSQLLSSPVTPGGSQPKAVLLIFYRGYW